MWDKVLPAYGFEPASAAVTNFGSGLINNTWKVEVPAGDFILQRINHQVFKRPQLIAGNLQMVGAYLQQNEPGYLFVTPAKTMAGDDMVKLNGSGYFRLLPFVRGSVTHTVVQTPEQAYEAARQFGKFTRLLAGFPAKTLQPTLPDFHNLTLRYHQFEEALEKGNLLRIQKARPLIGFIKAHRQILNTYEHILKDAAFKLRVTHHDAKISNVLFDHDDKGLCVIDLDTVMPGYFISDVGDMIRTYLSPVSEEEQDLSKICIREEYFAAIWQGYMHEMQDVLTTTEKQHFIYAGKFMIYMQAIRFLTDHILDDIYYGAKYDGHNLVRAGNQAALLQALLENEKNLLAQMQLKDAGEMVRV